VLILRALLAFFACFLVQKIEAQKSPYLCGFAEFLLYNATQGAFRSFRLRLFVVSFIIVCGRMVCPLILLTHQTIGGKKDEG
jgi:hypothetical protein